MPLPVHVRDPDTDIAAKVSPDGELYIAVRDYSTAYYISVNIADTPFEVVPAVANKRFIVTDILIASDKAFGSSVDAETVTIYEAHPADLDTNLKTFTQVDLLRNDRMPVTGLNLATNETVTLVAIAASASVDVTIGGYYIPINHHQHL